jgi:hypothetical protein
MMKKTSLPECWQQLKEGPKCFDYFCSTCGGKAYKAKGLLSAMSHSKIVRDLKDMTSCGLESADFDNGNADLNYFPKDRNVTDKVEFLLHAFSYLGRNDTVSLISTWAEKEIPLWLFDGISYYFIPETEFKKAWLVVIRERLNVTADSSLEETMFRKYSAEIAEEKRVAHQ